MLCYLMLLCYVRPMLCYVALCYVMLCYVMLGLCYVMFDREAEGFTRAKMQCMLKLPNRHPDRPKYCLESILSPSV